jgi:hypothetical protein
MDYQIRHQPDELDSTCYIEIGPGKYNGLHWQQGFAFIRDDAFAVAEGIVEKHFPAYDQFGMNDIPREVALCILSEWRSSADRLATLEREKIQTELNLSAALFPSLNDEIDSNRLVVANFLRSLANTSLNKVIGFAFSAFKG